MVVIIILNSFLFFSIFLAHVSGLLNFVNRSALYRGIDRLMKLSIDFQNALEVFLPLFYLIALRQNRLGALVGNDDYYARNFFF